MPPSVCYSLEVRPDGQLRKILIFGDAFGGISVFGIPDISENQLEQLKQLESGHPPSKSLLNIQYFFPLPNIFLGLNSVSNTSLHRSWKDITTPSFGVSLFL